MKPFKILFILCLVVFIACKEAPIEQTKTAVTKTEQSKIEHINATDFKAKMIKNPKQLVDVRTLKEYELGFIEGAQLITIGDTFIEQSANILDKNEPVYVYCKAGVRSARAADLLSKNGFTKIYNLRGGIVSWQDKGFPVKKE